MPPQRTSTQKLRRSHRHKPIPGKHLTPYQRGEIVGMRKGHMTFSKISKDLGVPLTTVKDTVYKEGEREEGQETGSGRGRPRKTTEAQDEQILQAALQDRHQNYDDIRRKVVPDVSSYTVRRRLREKHLRKWQAQERMRLEEKDAQERLEWALDHRHWTKEMWRKRYMWGDEVTVERGGGKRRKWIFRYFQEKWTKECVEPLNRVGERKVSQPMTGTFMGTGYGYFVPVQRDPESEGGGITARSLIAVMDVWFLDMWEEIKSESGEEIYLIIDNARNHLPLMRWLREKGVNLKELPPYSPDLNPIENIWSLIKDLLNKLYPDLYKLKGKKPGVKKAIEDAITHCWELLDSGVFVTLAESMVDRVQAVIDADGWYTKY